MRAVKRTENLFNGAVVSSSGSRKMGTVRSASPSQDSQGAVAPGADSSDEFFALDSRACFLHSEITSRTRSAAGPAKLMFACQP